MNVTELIVALAALPNQHADVYVTDDRGITDIAHEAYVSPVSGDVYII